MPTKPDWKGAWNGALAVTFWEGGHSGNMRIGIFSAPGPLGPLSLLTGVTTVLFLTINLISSDFVFYINGITQCIFHLN